ncbi:ATP-binding protein [Actinomadura sp. DSM 109109]|nr:ATP-binding protein [Actinomadura lepetitiana]
MNDLEFVAAAHGVPEVRLTLLAVPSSVVLARELVRYTLTNWTFDREVIDDASLVMSEIVSNAVAAAPARRIRLRCALWEEAPLLECWDPCPDPPVRCAPSLTAESGRGLAIVSALAQETGTRRSATGEGKVVWALMHT